MFGLKGLFGMPALYFDESAGAGGGNGGAGDSTDNSSGAGGDQAADKNAGEGNGDKVGKQQKAAPVFTPEQQEYIEKTIIPERLNRAKFDTEKVAEKARKEAEEKSLADKQEFEKLATSRKKEIDELTAKLEAAAGTEATLQQYKDAVAGIVKTQVEKLPKAVKSLIQKMDPLEQMQYLAENAKELNIDIKAVPPTETDDGNQKLKQEELDKARKKGEQTIKGFFR